MSGTQPAGADAAQSPSTDGDMRMPPPGALPQGGHQGRPLTQLIHGGIDGDPLTGAVNVPVYLTSTYKQDGLGRHRGYEYSRTGNPTRTALEALIADLEHGRFGLAFASGMAAITAVLSLFSQGDRIALLGNVYGGTFRVIDQIFTRFGLTYVVADPTDDVALKEALAAPTKALLVESPGNPLGTVSDIGHIAELAHRLGVLTIVDNTFLTPYLQRPLDLGADIVVHSATKYLGGHSDLVAGLVALSDQALADRLYFIQNATGGVLAPLDSYLVIRGIRTLGVRMDRHQANATALAEWLAADRRVARVYYPGLPTAQGYDLQRRQADGPGGVLSVELADGGDHVAFLEALRYITLAESLGGVESLACHPATMTHASIPAPVRAQMGISDRLVRLSIGLEDVADLREDLDRALMAAFAGAAGSAVSDGVGAVR
ncbi:MAG: PLP-dependent aspartate aminotransferase family protein [Bifidobacteriaceae bacterium]|jgi:cystathionine beta-lyase/cystathionine gamma-synthase|nr:PLP-dependent aspartate aminotransferase family protein [Bifidobacteriaceae bacterium]